MATGSPLDVRIVEAANARKSSEREVLLSARGAIGGAYVKDMPYSCRITAEIEPIGNNNEYGFFLRAGDKANDGYKLSFNPNKRTVRLGEDAFIEAVSGLDQSMWMAVVASSIVCRRGKALISGFTRSKGMCVSRISKYLRFSDG